jgi:hypothetical protein
MTLQHITTMDLVCAYKRLSRKAGYHRKEFRTTEAMLLAVEQELNARAARASVAELQREFDKQELL